jgi:hypothetical protein
MLVELETGPPGLKLFIGCHLCLYFRQWTLQQVEEGCPFLRIEVGGADVGLLALKYALHAPCLEMQISGGRPSI